MPSDVEALRFDPIHYRYWMGTRELLAVTHVLRAAGVVETGWYCETARDRGTAVHQATEAVDRDHVSGGWASDIEPYLGAYQQFLHDARPVWHGIEAPVADPCLGYAGTIDRWGTLQGDAVVVDLKTGTIPPWAPLQLVAYARLASGSPDGTRRRRLVVQLLPTGRYSVREYPLVNFGRDERVFLAALAVAHWETRGLGGSLMDATLTLAREVLPMRAEARAPPDTIRALTIVDDVTFTAAGALLVRIKALRATIEGLFASHIKRACEAHRALLEERRRLEAPLVEAEAALKRQLAAYTLAEETRRVCDARRRTADAQQGRMAQIRAEADDLDAAGHHTEAAELVADLDGAAAIPIAIIPAPITGPGIQCRDVWRYDVLDAAKVPREYLTIDHKKLGGVVRALKTGAQIPGVRIWAERTIVASGIAR